MSHLWEVSVDNYSELILATLRQIIRAIDLHSRDLARRYGLTGPQLLVLKELNKNNTSTISQLSKNISLSQATVTSILDRLEKQELVRRIRSQQDKRKVSIEMSARAIEILGSAPNLLQEDFTAKFEALEEWEKLSLIASLQRIAGMMSAESIVSPPVLTSGPLDATHSDVKEYLEERSDS
jgi:DNA-binding MarR family transcriptional regulator